MSTIENLEHEHTCVKCGRNYTHTHKAFSADHKQFPFQCPWKDCEWFIERGESKRVPTKDYAHRDRERTREPESMEPRGLIGLLKRAYQAGRTTCDNLLHHAPRATAPFFGQRDYGSILGQMLPGQQAKCTCQMDACRHEWTRFRDGQLTTEYVVPGSYHKGVPGHCKPGEPIKKVMHISHQLPDGKFEQITKDFPHYYVVTGENGHDHPLSHCRTKFGMAHQVGLLPKGTAEEPKRYLDLYGNPASNKRTNSAKSGLHVSTTVERCTPKDFIRAATKWGDWETDENVTECTMRDFTVNASPEKEKWVSKFDGFTSVHTLYYMQRNELASLLSKRKGSVLYALVHRHKDNTGTLNGGEQTYEKFMGPTGIMYVRQTNVGTGESYEHPDVDWLFSHDSWIGDDTNGLGWTIHEVCPDTYCVKMVHVPAPHVRMSPVHLTEDSNRIRMERAAGEIDPVVSVAVCGSVVTVKNVAPKTLKAMRLHASGKARTSDQFRDHLSATKRSLRKEKEDRADANEVALTSFFMDYDNDRRMSAKLFSDTGEDRKRFALELAGAQFNSCRNLADKLLAVGILGVSLHSSGGGHRAVKDAMRFGREMLSTNGTSVQV